MNEPVNSDHWDISLVLDSSNPNWHNSEKLNRFFIGTQQGYLNHLLAIRGHVLLNDLYEALGLPRTTLGATSGWLLGQDHIDLEVFAENSPALRVTTRVRANVHLSF